MLDPFRRAALAAVVFTIAGYATNAEREGWTRGAIDRLGVVSGLINVTVALAIGLFVDRLLRESDRRATLVAALTAAQQELADAQHQAGVQAERERLAREIHDTLAQGFTSIVMLARGDRRRARREHEPRVRDKLALLEETAAGEPRRGTRAGGRVAARRPARRRAARRAAPGDRPVCAARPACAADSPCRGTPRALASTYDVVLLRVAQEALANVGKHSPGEARHADA